MGTFKGSTKKKKIRYKMNNKKKIKLMQAY